MNKTMLASLALLPLGCVQGQGAPPPAASPAPVASVAAAPSPAAEAQPESAPATAPAPQAEPPKAPAPRRDPAPSGPAPASQPAAAAAEPTPAPKPRVRMVIPEGTHLPIEIQTSLSTASAREGDPVLAVLTEAVALKGFTLDKGAEVRGRVLTAVAAKRVKGRARLVVGFDAVMENGEKIAISTVPLDSSAESTSGKDKKIIAGSAVGGLILGAIKDGKKGAVIGTVVGAAAGTGAVLIMKGDEVELPRGAQLTLVVQ